MDRIIGAVLGLAAFVAVIALSLAKGVSFAGCAFRAVVALVLGYLVGRLVFGLPGLSIVKEYVQLHRGQVEILDGPGAHFRIRFPRKREVHEEAA